MFLQFPEPALGRTRSTRKNSVTLTEFFGIGMRKLRCLVRAARVRLTAAPDHPFLADQRKRASSDLPGRRPPQLHFPDNQSLKATRLRPARLARYIPASARATIRSRWSPGRALVTPMLTVTPPA